MLKIKRITWLSVLGVHVDLWDAGVINKIYGRLGRIVLPTTTSILDRALCTSEIGVLVSHGNPISEVADVTWGSKRWEVWISNDRSQSLPPFVFVCGDFWRISAGVTSQRTKPANKVLNILW
ncbi:hypothetical protein HanIR_Chr16g0803981 [Helianthus annuus]|nr:hypothetical protein HanIR_Chr16g0803981 [Helianthus annuus]